MQLRLKYPIGARSVLRRSPLLADGVEIGEMFADHPPSGWRGTVSTYRFHANERGLSLGLPRIIDARTQREVLSLLVFKK